MWQYVTNGLVYIPEAIDTQNGEGYDFGGMSGMRATKNAGGYGGSTFASQVRSSGG